MPEEVVNLDEELENADWLKSGKTQELQEEVVNLDEDPENALWLKGYGQTSESATRSWDAWRKGGVGGGGSVTSAETGIARENWDRYISDNKQELDKAGLLERAENSIQIMRGMPDVIAEAESLPPGKAFTARAGEESDPAGYIHARRRNGEVHVVYVATNPAQFKGMPNAQPGTGTRLLYETTSWSLKNGASSISLSPIPSAEPFYAKLGFKAVGAGSPDWVLPKDKAETFVKNYETAKSKGFSEGDDAVAWLKDLIATEDECGALASDKVAALQQYSQYARDKCMDCSEPPTVEILWAEGMAHAWFCDKHFQEWVSKGDNKKELSTQRKLPWGLASVHWKDGAPTKEDAEAFKVRKHAQVAGTTGRRARGNTEKATNEYQGKLVAVYDAWAGKAQREMVRADKAGEDMGKVVDGLLKDLSKQLKEVGRQGVLDSILMGMGGRAPDSKALKKIAEQVTQNDRYVDDLMPGIREQLQAHIKGAVKTYQLEGSSLLSLLQSLRGKPSGLAGMFWQGLFIGAGIVQQEDNAQLQADGQAPRPVRWVLDPNAKHCQDSPGFMGCEGLAGEYKSWDAMPTVPAGQVTCRGNCRCNIEVLNDAGMWERVT